MATHSAPHVRKVMVSVEDDESGLVLTYDCIWREGHWWIVSAWRQVHATGQKQPIRLLRPLAAWEASGPDSQWMNPIVGVPKAALDGIPTAGFVVGVVDQDGAQHQPPKH